MRKKYLSSPLPFQGQKRRFVKDVLRVVKDCPGDTVFVDLFGGSGLLSHAIKRSRPHSEVVYNDYDDFSLRLKNVENTNNLLAELRELVAGQPVHLLYQRKIKYCGAVRVDELTPGLFQPVCGFHNADQHECRQLELKLHRHYAASRELP